MATDANSGSINWEWPLIKGPHPISQDIHSEMFDRSDYPYPSTFVRETLQNSLDARLDDKKPVVVDFRFHNGSDRKGAAGRKKFLEQVFEFRKNIGREAPPPWEKGVVPWLIVEDFNTTGLLGDLDSRLGDFWNYWLNFCVSNKSAKGSRGGRGIGRVTFLIASEIQSVLGYTKTVKDISAVCGMAFLGVRSESEELHSTHAYLAKNENGNIFDLHGVSTEAAFRKAFSLTEYAEKDSTGLALVVPYPKLALTRECILAAAIENFAPAVLDGSLIVKVDKISLDCESILLLGKDEEVVAHFRPDGAISRDPDRYLNLLRDLCFQEDFTQFPIVKKGSGKLSDVFIKELKDPEDSGNVDLLSDLLTSLKDGKIIFLEIAFPILKDEVEEFVSLRCIVRISPYSKDEGRPKDQIDSFFRDGMLLPKLASGQKAGLDVIFLASDKILTTYMNLCEGKAHLDLDESGDVKEKLKRNGFPDIDVKRFLKNLPTNLRNVLMPDMEEPDLDILKGMFSIPKKDSPDTDRDSREGRDSEFKPGVASFLGCVIRPVPNGFRITGREDFADWPVGIRVQMAYCDGTPRPSWEEDDFRIGDLDVSSKNCLVLEKKDNFVILDDCRDDFSLEICGFDYHRELSVIVDLHDA